MGTITSATKGTPTGSRKLVEMNWDPITRIVGSLGIFTKIDFDNRQVAECHSTSSIFRGYSIFMKGKDPRNPPFLPPLPPKYGVRRSPAGDGRMDCESRRSRRIHVRSQHLPG